MHQHQDILPANHSTVVFAMRNFWSFVSTVCLFICLSVCLCVCLFLCLLVFSGCWDYPPCPGCLCSEIWHWSVCEVILLGFIFIHPSELNGSGKSRPPTDNFVAIFQVAQNPLKFAMLTLFVLTCLFFFSRKQKYNMDKIARKFPPPFPSLSVSKQRRISILESQNTVCVCCTLLEGWGGGVGVQERV